MNELAMAVHNGICTSKSDLELEAGFLRTIKNWIYRPDDPTRLWKIAGRNLAIPLPTGLTSGTDLSYLQYESSDSLLLYSGTKLYTQAAVTSGGTAGGWTTAKDAAATDYGIAGNYMRAIHDGANRWLAFTGHENQKTLVRDSDGLWRFLGLKKPAQCSALARITTVTAAYNPDASSNAVGGGFTNPANAYDTSLTTYASASRSSPGTTSQVWEWTDAGTIPANAALYIKLGTSSLPPSGEGGGGEGGAGGGGGEALEATLKVEVSYNNGAAYTTIFEKATPVSTQTASANLTAGGNWTDLWVRVSLEYASGTVTVTGRVYEIYAQTGGGSGINGNYTFYYAVTEVYRKTLGDGSVVEVESAPSDVGVAPNTDAYSSVSTTAGDGTTGVTLALPARKNLDTDGTAATYLFRNIYRSTGTGSWPNLGKIGTAQITDTSFTDTFSIAPDVLGSPTILVYSISNVYYNGAGEPPPFLDATLYKGAVVAVNATDPYRLNWSLPGRMEYWPAFHDISLLPSDRGDRLKGCTAVGEKLVIFTNSRVLRLDDIVFISDSSPNITGINPGVLSPNAGLATDTPHGYCLLQNQKGNALLMWIAHNGIWMTDGYLVSERGMGVVKCSVYLDWDNLVDKSQLGSARLTYDPEIQAVIFDFQGADGLRQCIYFHTSPHHWVASGQDQLVPKMTGPHDQRMTARTVGELSGRLRHFGLVGASSDTEGIYLENSGTTDAASFSGTPTIQSFLESGWFYSGANKKLRSWWLLLYHSNWQVSGNCLVEFLARSDATGNLQMVQKSVSLAGSRISRIWVDRTAHSFAYRIWHRENQSGAIGPLGLVVSDIGAVIRS